MPPLTVSQVETLHRIPPLAIAIFITDRTCHFGSFALECLVFLTLWYVLDAAYQRLVR